MFTVTRRSCRRALAFTREHPIALTVIVLVLPYLVFSNYYLCLVLSLLIAILIIAGFNYYVAVARDEPFRTRFIEMAGLSLAVAVLSFGVGYLIRVLFGVDV